MARRSPRLAATGTATGNSIAGWRPGSGATASFSLRERVGVKETASAVRSPSWPTYWTDGLDGQPALRGLPHPGPLPEEGRQTAIGAPDAMRIGVIGGGRPHGPADRRGGPGSRPRPVRRNRAHRVRPSRSGRRHQFPDVSALAAASDAVIDFTHAAVTAVTPTRWRRQALPGSSAPPAYRWRTTPPSPGRPRPLPSCSLPTSAWHHLLLALAEQLGVACPATDYDAEILEMHHNQKWTPPPALPSP